MMNFFKKTCYVVSFLISSMAAAYPTDFPPTAFQLAQIHQFTLNPDGIDHQIGKMHERTQAEDTLEYHPSVGTIPPSWNFVIEAEKIIRPLIPLPLDATEDQWRAAIQHLLTPMLNLPPTDMLMMSFSEPECTELILKAIMLEVDAMKNGQIVLWRGSADSPEDLKKKKTVTKTTLDKNNQVIYQNLVKNYSFSLGLFSGFINDGYRHHNTFDDIVSACTYTYLSSYLYQKRIQKEGPEGLWDSMRRQFPGFFVANPKYPVEYNAEIEISDVIYHVERWSNSNCEGCKNSGKYRNTETNNQCQKCAGIFRKLYNEKSKIWGFGPGTKLTSPNFYLFGVKISPDELEQRRLEALQENSKHHQDISLQRGDFLKPHHAVYGAGEWFHPKLPFLESADTTVIHFSKGTAPVKQADVVAECKDSDLKPRTSMRIISRAEFDRLIGNPDSDEDQ